MIVLCKLENWLVSFRCLDVVGKCNLKNVISFLFRCLDDNVEMKVEKLTLKNNCN